MKITAASILARFGPGFSGCGGMLLIIYGLLEPHRPWLIGGCILLAAAVVASRLKSEKS